MPRGDGTGPRGMGPMTGRGLGNCSPGVRRGLGLAVGLGLGLGLRRRFRRLWGTNTAPNDELSILKSQASLLEEDLSVIKEKINELENKGE
ncbi:MAG: DUF5320 domain-containing protein [Candidatus Gastranaerophilales bacterium]|nr:DUF5320 domain-containing protein [Candidatus Gastranaerophilales bacterium]